MSDQLEKTNPDVFFTTMDEFVFLNRKATFFRFSKSKSKSVMFLD